MAQKANKRLPLFINTDKSPERLDASESPFIKNLGFDANGNPSLGQGSSTPVGEGANLLSLTPTRSNIPFNTLPLPKGFNKDLGAFESVVTQEMYWFVYNDQGNHSIFVLDGNIGIISKVVQDSALQFSDDPKAYIAEHRVRLRIVQDKYGNVVQKALLITDGNSWQKWINVIPAVATNGFDISRFPYWTLQQPHFDRRELFEWAARPIMYNPIAVTIPNTAADATKVNNIVDRAFRFAAVPNLTDGRFTPLSPYSTVTFIKTEDFLNNPDNISKNIQITLYAGSPLWESVDIYVQQTAKVATGSADQLSWGPWIKYIRLYKFTNCGANDPSLIGNQYWLRTNPWAGLNYDPIQNSIQYIFDNSLLGELPVIDTTLLDNGMPQVSRALTDLGDAALLCSNREGYDNFDCNQTNNLDVSVEEIANSGCNIPTRKIRLYAVATRRAVNASYISQVGYYVGQDTQIRFGSLQASTSNFATFNETESKFYNLDFADHSAFVCYLKGTEYFSVGKWYVVNQDNTLTALPEALDFSNEDVLLFVNNLLTANCYFVCVFDFEVPAGNYIATLGRHNVNLTADFKNTSTYITGIANSRVKSVFFNRPGRTVTSITPSALVNTNKEMEINCINADVDVWGNGADLFYVFVPYQTQDILSVNYVMIEGYFKESIDNQIGVEKFPYIVSPFNDILGSGSFTDKNGFYFLYIRQLNSYYVTRMTAKLNCTPTIIDIPNANTSAYTINGNSYLTDHNGGVVGDCNRMILNGKITDPTGQIGYSNVAISIVGGATALTEEDGTFQLVIHNGFGTPLVANVYINSGSNFIITIQNCGYIPLFSFNEALVPCVFCLPRIYPTPLNLLVMVSGGTQTSLKENAPYIIGVAGADLAGRLMFPNVVKQMTVPSYFSRQDLLATFFRLLITGALKLPADIKWFAPYVSPQLDKSSYVQWVGDFVNLVDASGNVVTDSESAVFIAIGITSLYNYNVNNNFSILANYQFQKGDRIRILNDGGDNLLDVNVQVLGTTYNQAAINADLIPNPSNTPVTNITNQNTIENNITTGTTPSSSVSLLTQQQNVSAVLFIRYTSALDSIIGKNGVWIELLTPQQQSSDVPLNELTWYPVINGEVATFTGFANGKPTYNFLSQIDIPYFDTYLFRRNIVIPNVGNLFFPFAFESPNISDSWGANINSGGRQNVKNDNAKQLWLGAGAAKSGKFVTTGLLNGMNIFLPGDKKDFSQYPWGDIVAVFTQMSFVFFICENDYFSTDYNYHYAYPNDQGVMVTNLDDQLSTPHQKIGNKFGCRLEDTGTIIFFEDWAVWYDAKNYAYIVSNYRIAKDVGIDKIKAYLKIKTDFVTNWNLTHDTEDQIDIISGVDPDLKNVYMTFRPRRGKTGDLNSFVNKRRSISVNYQETIVYSLKYDQFIRFVGFCPEGYGKIRGSATGKQLVSFALGNPYYHNTGNSSFGVFYGIQTEELLVVVLNEGADENQNFANFCLDIEGGKMYIDKMYTNIKNSLSYIPLTLFTRKEGFLYASVQRDMHSYPPIDPADLFSSMLFDGKKIMGKYLVARLVRNLEHANEYFELNQVFNLITDTVSEKK